MSYGIWLNLYSKIWNYLMNDIDILKKYNKLVDSGQRKVDLFDKERIEIDSNNAIALMYINDNIGDIKIMASTRLYPERADVIIAYIENNIGAINKTFVYKQLRKHGILDELDIMLLGFILLISVMLLPALLLSSDFNWGHLLLFYFVPIICFGIAMKFIRYLINEG